MKKSLLLIIILLFFIGFTLAQDIERINEINSSKEEQSAPKNFSYNLLYTCEFPANFDISGWFYWEGKLYVANSNLDLPDNELGKIWRFNFNNNSLEPDGYVIVPIDTAYYYLLSEGAPELGIPPIWDTLPVNSNFYQFTTDGTYFYAMAEILYGGVFVIDPTTWTLVDVIHRQKFFNPPYPPTIAYDYSDNGYWVTQGNPKCAIHYSSDWVEGVRLYRHETGNGISGLAYDNISENGPYLIGAFGNLDCGTLIALINRWHIATEIDEGIIIDLTLELLGEHTWVSNGPIYTYIENGKHILLGIIASHGLIYAYELNASVADITDVSTTVTAGTSVTLTGNVAPNNAVRKTITWSLVDAGSTGAAITDNTFHTTAEGTAIIKATIVDGIINDNGTLEDYTQNFTISVNPPNFISVMNIIDVPTTATANIPLTLTGTVVPDNATNQTITWNLADAGATGAIITDNTFLATDEGMAAVTATVADGRSVGLDFTQDFIIEVKILSINESPELSAIKVYPNPTTGELIIDNEQLIINNVQIFDVFGRVLLSQITNRKQQTILDISHLQAGTYFVKITTEAGEAVRKVVKQ